MSPQCPSGGFGASLHRCAQQKWWAAGPLPTAAQARARRGTQGPTLWTGGSEEQSGHAQEVVAESRAEQERCGRGMKRLSRRGGAQGPRGSSWGRQLASCSEVLRVCGVPGWLQQLLPWPDPRLAPLPGRWEEKQAPPGSYCPWTSTWEVHA